MGAYSIGRGGAQIIFVCFTALSFFLAKIFIAITDGDVVLSSMNYFEGIVKGGCVMPAHTQKSTN